MKVALCLMGVIGGDKGKSGAGSPDGILKIGHEHFKKHILNKNDVDVFVHTWNTDKAEDIERIYKPKAALYQKQLYFDIPDHVGGPPTGLGPQGQRKNNHYSRWYSTKQAIALKEKHEKANGFKYDYVMVSRFDIAWQKDVVFDEFNSSAFYAGNWNRFFYPDGREVKNRLYYNQINDSNKGSLKEILAGYPHNEEGTIDFWYFANSENMDKFGRLFDNLDEYTKPENCPTDHEGWISNHRLSLYHIQQTGLIDNFKFAYHLHDDFPLVRRWYYKCGR